MAGLHYFMILRSLEMLKIINEFIQRANIQKGISLIDLSILKTSHQSSLRGIYCSKLQNSITKDVHLIHLIRCFKTIEEALPLLETLYSKHMVRKRTIERDSIYINKDESGKIKCLLSFSDMDTDLYYILIQDLLSLPNALDSQSNITNLYLLIKLYLNGSQDLFYYCDAMSNTVLRLAITVIQGI